MNLAKEKIFIKKNKNVKIMRKNGRVYVENTGENEETVILPKVLRLSKECLYIEFGGKVISGTGACIKIVNRKRKVVCETEFNSKLWCERPTKYGMIALRIEARTKICIERMEITETEEYQRKIKDLFKGDIAVMSPGYPSNGNKYMCAFVHTRVKEYKKLNWDFDVFSVNAENKTKIYEYEGIRVCQISYTDLRCVLSEKKYEKILIHFFNEYFSYVMDAVDTSNTKLYLYSHGADTMYRDFNKITAKYFEQPKENTLEQEQYFRQRDNILNKYNNLPNVKWLFCTDWTRRHSEELNNIKYNNYEILPCFVDDRLFKFEKKNPELRKKIFMIRKFDNINTYSLDIDVRVILELSRRAIFKDLEFNIYGQGSEHEVLLEPVKKFENVHIYNRFLSHEEIAEAHKKNGIALFATRYDSQAVSSCEAAMSGLVVISSNNTGVYQEINPDYGTLCETENYIEYADKIEQLYYNPELFVDLSKKMHDYVYEKYCYEKTIKKELDIFAEDDRYPIESYKRVEPEKEVLLTVAIPSYNVEKYLKNGVMSLINHEYANKLEILIINDGSKDRTAEIARKLQEETTVNGKCIVRLVDKENGGHGSTINKGIEQAHGKYFKLMDGDDFFETEEFKKLIKILENEDSDIVLNNYIEDHSGSCTRNYIHNYDFMVPGLQYNIEDLCYKGYGFKEWGPLLSTSTFKTEILKKANFRITEKCFYVDMELNMYAFISAKTVVYYPLDLYVYYIGRAGQSISTESLRKNCDMHRKVTLNLIKIYNQHPELSESKKKYLEKNLILKMIEAHYYICIDLYRNGKKFREFEKEIKKYPIFYCNPKISTRKVKFNRMFNGHLILMRWPINLIKKVLKKEK